MKMPSDMRRHATISDCCQFRYRLWRKWAIGSPLLFVMLNPSTADGLQDDATIRRCYGFAARAGFGELEVVNLYAYRATKPAELKAAGYPVGPENDQHIREAVLDAAAVCVAWGANVAGLSRPAEALTLLRDLGVNVKCLRITRSGYPQHPLMLPSDCSLQSFNTDTIQEAMQP